MKEVKIGMLGSGFVANFYMQGLADVPGQSVEAVYSNELAEAKEFADKWGIPQAVDDFDRMLEKDLDLYLIALPNFLHKDFAVRLAKAGKNMVCTKPLARSGEEAAEMLRAVKEAGVMHGYAETEVFAPAVVKARSLIEEGALGELYWVRSREAHAGPHSRWFYDPKLSGGGALMDMGCHCLEAARYFFGKDVRPEAVFAWGTTLEHDTEAEDNAIAVVRFEGGKMSHLEVSWTAKGGLDLRNEIYGSEGSIFTDVTRGTPIEAFTKRSSGYIVEKADAETGWVKPVPEEAFTYGYQAEMKHFVECVRENRMPRETFEDGYIINCLMDAAYRSMKSGKWEEVNIEEI